MKIVYEKKDDEMKVFLQTADGKKDYLVEEESFYLALIADAQF